MPYWNKKEKSYDEGRAGQDNILPWPANEFMENMRRFREITPELQSFMDDIDWSPFRDFLLKEYGLDGDLEYGLEGSGSTYISPFIRKPENLREKCGIFAKAYTKVELKNFGSGIYREVISYNEAKYRKFIDEGNFRFNDEDIETVLGPLILWASMDLLYEHADGGRNGTELFSCRYTSEGGWLFRKVGK